jgi:Tfp pilus tip-associated adhesin PilY1
MNGNEIWGFIPPNIFQHKLKDLKFDANDWIEGNGLTRTRSNHMILLDGMLVAKDVENQNPNNFRTLLTGYLGHGGNGFYTMDITEMDSSLKAPVFLWAIENARNDESGTYPGSNMVTRWGEALAGSETNYDYSDLGLTIVHGVNFIPAAGGSDTIGVLPGGLGHKLGVNDTQGKAFYFFNPNNGMIIRKIDSNSNASTGFDAPNGRKLGMGVSPIIYQENSAKKTIGFYTADSEGNIFQCVTEKDNIQNWKLKSIFQLRTLGSSHPYGNVAVIPSAEDLAVTIPKKMLLVKSSNNYMWLFGGSSNLYAPGSDASDSKKLINGEQFIFGLNINNLKKSDELNSGITPSNGEIRKLPYYADNDNGIISKYGSYGQQYEYDPELGVGVKYAIEDYGWVLRLRQKFGVTDTEYLSANPYLMNNVLYFATFIPYAGSNPDEICNDIGFSRLYALDPSTGLSVIPDEPAIVLENVKIAGVSGNPSTNRLILSVKELGKDAISGTKSKFDVFNRIGDSLIEVNAPVDPVEPSLGFEEESPQVLYWKEKF